MEGVSMWLDLKHVVYGPKHGGMLFLLQVSSRDSGQQLMHHMNRPTTIRDDEDQ